LYFFTASGEAATRGSDGSIFLATAIFMGPPAARGERRARKLALVWSGWIPVLRPELAAILQDRASHGGAIGQASGPENRHHRTMKITAAVAVFHQHDEALIGLLMGPE